MSPSVALPAELVRDILCEMEARYLKIHIEVGTNFVIAHLGFIMSPI